MKHFRFRFLVFALLLVAPLGLRLHSVATEPPKPKYPHADNLGSASWWLTQMKSQAAKYRGQHFQGCLFGDSISSGLGNQLGVGIANFATSGLSSVSLVEQLKILRSQNIHCRSAIIAVGTNDAWYITPNGLFVSKLKQAIHFVRRMGAREINLIPAFYSTLAASKDPSKAGAITRVEEINNLMRQVAIAENIPIHIRELQVLFANKCLREDMTFDGVHLNDNGKQIYRQLVINLLSANS